jgi:hypothetical protein
MNGRDESVISMAEKREHFREVQETAARQAPQADAIGARAGRLADYDPGIAPPRPT